MNMTRRNEIKSIIEDLGALKERIEAVGQDEQEAYDNLPEGIQDSERGQNMEQAISDLEDAASNIEDIVDTLQDIVDR